MRIEKFGNNVLANADCLVAMKKIRTGSVDAVICDPPYGTTACKWDSVIDLELMWGQLKRVIKPNGVIAMTAAQPFTTALISSNMCMFKYCGVWAKNRPSGFAQAKNKLMSIHEDILIFSDGVTVHKGQSKRRMTYNPQGLLPYGKRVKNNSGRMQKDSVFAQRPNAKQTYTQEFTNYPTTILEFDCEVGLHPTQKPVALMEYLIKTYTNKGEVVLDFAYGSGTTGEACVNTNRKFIGIELDTKHFNIGLERIRNATPK